MTIKSDIEIAQEAKPLPITDIADACGMDGAYIEQYGRYKAKIDNRFLKETNRPDGKLVLVTAITPTPAGEGKTTTTVGLADGLRRIGRNAVVALREPSLGPVFGIKGGAAGGGYAQVVPMEDINLHFTGDFHAIGAANNLLAAMLDNHIQQGNALGIDVKRITWRRCVDMNDRQLRSIVDGLGGRMQGVPREDGFDITVASEVMAVLCLASDIPDLKARLGRIVVGYTYDDAPVTAADLKAQLNRIEAQLELQDQQNRGIIANQRKRMALSVVLCVIILAALAFFSWRMNEAYVNVMDACNRVNDLADTVQTSLDTLDQAQLDSMMQDLPEITAQLKKVDVDALNKVLTELPALMDTVNSLQTQVQNISNWFSSLGSVFGR